MGGTAAGVIKASFTQAKGSVDRVAHIAGVSVLLPVVLPPADGA